MDIKELWINMKFQTLRNFRETKFLISMIVPASFSLLFYFIPLFGDGFPDEPTEYISTSFAFVGLILIFNALYLGADAINREHYSKTALFIFPMPQRRSIVIIAKYIVQLLTSWLSISVYYGVTIVTFYITYPDASLPSEMLRSLLFSFLYMSAQLSFAFFLSAWLRNPAASMTLTFVGLMIFFPILNRLLGMIDVDTTWIFTNYSSFITSVFRFPSESFGPTTGEIDLDFYFGVKYLFLHAVGLFVAALGIELRNEV